MVLRIGYIWNSQGLIMNNIPIMYLPLKNAKRIKIYIPFELKELRRVFKKVNSTFWHPSQKLWSIINTPEL